MQRNPKTLTTLHSSGTKRFLTSWGSSFDTRRERHNFYYADCSYIAHSQPPARLTRPRVKSQLTDLTNAHLVAPGWTARPRGKISTNWPQPIASGHDVIHTPIPFPIWGFYYDICDCHIICPRTWTVFDVCTCICTKPNSSKSNQTEW